MGEERKGRRMGKENGGNIKKEKVKTNNIQKEKEKKVREEK